jgi:hypothetical protein
VRALSNARFKILAHLLDEIEIAAARERLAGAGDDHGRHPRIRIHVAPDLGQLMMHDGIGGVQPPRAVHGDTENALLRPIQLQPLIVGVKVAHIFFSWFFQ